MQLQFSFISSICTRSVWDADAQRNSGQNRRYTYVCTYLPSAVVIGELALALAVGIGSCSEQLRSQVTGRR